MYTYINAELNGGCAHGWQRQKLINEIYESPWREKGKRMRNRVRHWEKRNMEEGVIRKY